MADSRLVVTVTEQGSEKVEKKLKGITQTGKKVEKQTSSMSDKFKQFGSSASQAVAAVDGPLGGISSRVSSLTQLMSSGPTGLVGVTVAATSAFTVLTIATANQVRELSNLADLAGVTTHELTAMNHVAMQFGLIDLADKFKDVKERVGEFITSGGGGLQDFADVLNMSTDETLVFAKAMENLTGEQVLKRLVSDMEDAGASTAQMSFALEGVAGDLTMLIPSLINGASEFNRLKESAESFTSPLTQEEVDDYRELAANVDLATIAFSSMVQNGISPAVKFVSELAVEWAHLLASFNEGTIPQITSDMADISEEINDVRNQIKNLDDGVSIWEALDPTQGKDAAFLQKQLKDLESQYDSLAAKYKTAAGLDLPTPATSTPVSENEVVELDRAWETESEKKKAVLDAAAAADKARVDAQIENMLKSFMTEQELFEQQQQWIIENVTNQEAMYELLGSLDDTYYAKKAENQKADIDNATRNAERQKKIDERDRKTRLGYLDQSTSDMKTAFGEQSGIYKAAAIVNTTISTYEAATGAYKALAGIPVVGPGLGIAASAAAVAAGLANVAQIRGARLQGGQVTAGKPYIVGERGQETFVPSGNGKIVPNNKMGGSGGVSFTVLNQAQPVTLNQVSETTDEDGMRRIVVEMVPEIVGRLAGDPDSDLNTSQQRLYPTARGF